MHVCMCQVGVAPSTILMVSIIDLTGGSGWGRMIGEREANVGLTGKQKDFYDRLRRFVSRNGYFPSVRLIGERFGFSSPATVHAYLRRLQKNGLLDHSPSLGWSLVQDQCDIPLVGIVPAGSPSELFSALGEELTLPSWMVGEGQMLAFRVSGDSMRDAFILDGDVVVVRPSVQAEIGEMVVALLDEGGITLKRLARVAGRLVLKPENPEYSVITDAFTLVGKVISVFRRFR